MRSIGLCALLLLLSPMLVGCAAGPTQYAVPAGQYGPTFEAARLALRDERWLIDRVDAAGGVLTTQRRPEVLAGSPDDTIENIINRQQRYVRIEFAPAAGAAAPIPAADPADPTLSSKRPDLTAGDVAVVMRVRVFIERVQNPGWRVSSVSVRHNTYTKDPALRERGMEPAYSATLSEDDVMASDLAEMIARRMGLSPAGP